MTGQGESPSGNATTIHHCGGGSLCQTPLSVSEWRSDLWIGFLVLVLVAAVVLALVLTP